MEKAITFGIKGIEIINSVIKAPADSRQISAFTFDINFKANINNQDNILSILADVLVWDIEKTNQIGQYSVALHFGVEELEKVVSETGLNQIEIPRDFLDTLLGITVSTLRGLMFESFRGTFLHNAILPLIDIRTLQHELALQTN